MACSELIDSQSVFELSLFAVWKTLSYSRYDPLVVSRVPEMDYGMSMSLVQPSDRNTVVLCFQGRILVGDAARDHVEWNLENSAVKIELDKLPFVWTSANQYSSTFPIA